MIRGDLSLLFPRRRSAQGGGLGCSRALFDMFDFILLTAVSIASFVAI